MVSIVTKGRSFAGMMNWLNARMSANQGCNTAKGVLFAAPFFKYIMDGEVLLQYRERAEPFAAPAFFSRYITKAQKVSKIHRTLTVVKTSLCYIQYYHIFEK